MEHLQEWHQRTPERIQVDKGSEFISKVLDKWACENEVILDFSRPGKPTDNPFIESFNGSFRDECLNMHWFLSLNDAKEKIESWRQDYNTFRPHSSLDNLTPEQFREKHLEAGNFSLWPVQIWAGAQYLGMGKTSTELKIGWQLALVRANKVTNTKQ
jgi:putative transposase